MPGIQDDAAWPAHLTRLVDRAHAKQHSTKENRYYGAYNAMLTYCFAADGETYLVHPQCGPNDNSREQLDYIVLYVLDVEDRPVMFIEVKDDSWKDHPETRRKADRQMRDRYAAMFAQCHIPTLYGISILGTHLHVYRGVVATGEVAPVEVAVPNPHRTLPADFLADRWPIDIRSQDAFERLKQIVMDIANEIANL